MAPAELTAPRIFVSYNHQQRDWVKNDLVPLLEAGGAEVLVDYREFEVGGRVVGQMDGAQDRAVGTVCILTPGYCASDYCMHELNRAMDKQNSGHKVIPVMREAVAAPERLGGFDALLRVDLIETSNNDQWQMLFDACGVKIGASATQWLEARSDIKQFLGRGISVNLVVRGKGVAWRGLLKQLQLDKITCCRPIDLASGIAASRRALIEEMLRGCGIMATVPEGNEDLAVLHREICKYPGWFVVTFTHFDMVKQREWYGNSDLFGALRNLMTDERKLVLLIQSRQHFAQLLPRDNPLSSISDIRTVELGGVG